MSTTEVKKKTEAAPDSHKFLNKDRSNLEVISLLSMRPPEQADLKSGNGKVGVLVGVGRDSNIVRVEATPEIHARMMGKGLANVAPDGADFLQDRDFVLYIQPLGSKQKSKIKPGATTMPGVVTAVDIIPRARYNATVTADLRDVEHVKARIHPDGGLTVTEYPPNSRVDKIISLARDTAQAGYEGKLREGYHVSPGMDVTTVSDVEIQFNMPKGADHSKPIYESAN